VSAAAMLGELGGAARARKLTAVRRAEIVKKAATRDGRKRGPIPAPGKRHRNWLAERRIATIQPAPDLSALAPQNAILLTCLIVPDLSAGVHDVERNSNTFDEAG
jgi:hypothetical protein